jgi:prevent-host-death family protein
METTTASRFKAKLGHYMRMVRGGEEVVVTDRDRPIARFVPFEERSGGPVIQFAQRRLPDAPPLGQIQVRAVRGAESVDTTALVRGDRDRR